MKPTSSIMKPKKLQIPKITNFEKVSASYSNSEQQLSPSFHTKKVMDFKGDSSTSREELESPKFKL